MQICDWNKYPAFAGDWGGEENDKKMQELKLQGRQVVESCIDSRDSRVLRAFHYISRMIVTWTQHTSKWPENKILLFSFWIG